MFFFSFRKFETIIEITQEFVLKTTDVLVTFQVESLRDKNLPINRIDRLNSLVEFKRYAFS